MSNVVVGVDPGYGPVDPPEPHPSHTPNRVTVCSACGLAETDRGIEMPCPLQDYPPVDEEAVVSREDDLAFRIAVMEADRAFEADGAAGTKNWFRDYFVPRLGQRGLRIIRMEPAP